jgi:hypothetical protein
VRGEIIHLTVRCEAKSASCPNCSAPSNTIHSRYPRRLAKPGSGAKKLAPTEPATSPACLHRRAALSFLAPTCPRWARRHANPGLDQAPSANLCNSWFAAPFGRPQLGGATEDVVGHPRPRIELDDVVTGEAIGAVPALRSSRSCETSLASGWVDETRVFTSGRSAQLPRSVRDSFRTGIRLSTT